MSTEFVLEWIERKMGFAHLPKSSMTPVFDLGQHADLEPLVIAASIFFDEVDAGVLARLLEVDDRLVSNALDLLAQTGVLRMRSRGRYAFVDLGVRQASYEAIPEDTRSSLHRGVAETFGARSRSATLEDTIEAARQWQAGGAGADAVRCWRHASQLGIATQALPLAARCLEDALKVGRNPAFKLSPHEEFLTLSALGPLQAQLSGSGSTEVANIYARCLEIAETYDHTETAAKFDALWGLTACILVHGRVGTALEMCERLLHTAHAAGDDRHILLSTRLKGLGQLLAGQVPAAIDTLATVLRLYDFDAHAALRLQYASDQAALALAHLSWAQVLVGDLDESDRNCAAALNRAQMLNHPHTSAHVTCILAARAQTLGRRYDAATLATGALALARHYRYPYWQAWAEIIIGWHEGGRDPVAGTTRIEGAIAAYQLTGAGQALAYAHLLRAGLLLDSGRLSQAIVAADQALACGAAHGVELFDADILRIKALAQGGHTDERRQLLQEALGIARRQGCKLFETRISSALGQWRH